MISVKTADTGRVKTASREKGSYYLNQCWNIVNWTKLETNFNEILIEIHSFY